MKITGIDIRKIKVNARGDWIFVFVRTDAGITGVGEASQSGNDDLVVAHLRRMESVITGQDPSDIVRISARLAQMGVYRWRFGLGTAAAVEMALWDICGKSAGLPVYKLLGGALRRSIRLYANINRGLVERTPEEFADTACRAMEDGFTAVKCDPFDGFHLNGLGKGSVEAAMEQGTARLRAIRDGIGDGIDLMVDVHARFNVPSLRTLVQRLAEFNLLWLEDPVPIEHFSFMGDLRRETQTAIAGGEGLHSPEEFKSLLDMGCLDVFLPDVKYCGGILPLKRISSLIDMYGALVAPHGPCGPVGIAASVHAMLGTPNFLILEYPFGEVDWRDRFTKGTEHVSDGQVPLPDAPGLGIELDESMLE